MVIKCNVCKLDVDTCDYQCLDMDDVSPLFKDAQTAKNALDGFCTNHACPHNKTGFKCSLNECELTKNK